MGPSRWPAGAVCAALFSHGRLKVSLRNKERSRRANFDRCFSNDNMHRRINAFQLAVGTIERRLAVSGELFTSACGHFTEELPVVFSLARIEKSEKVGKSPPLTTAPGCDCNRADDCRQTRDTSQAAWLLTSTKVSTKEGINLCNFFETAAIAAWVPPAALTFVFGKKKKKH